MKIIFLVRSAKRIINLVTEYLNQERSIAGLAFWIHDNYASKCRVKIVKCRYVLFDS